MSKGMGKHVSGSEGHGETCGESHPVGNVEEVLGTHETKVHELAHGAANGPENG